MSTKDINLEQSTPPEHRQTKPVVTFLKTNEGRALAYLKKLGTLIANWKYYMITYIIILNEYMVQLTT